MGNENLMTDESVNRLGLVLTKQIDKENFRKKYAKAGEVLKLVGAGVFLASSVVVPNLPKMLAPFFKSDEYEAWKRFNIPYLKRTLYRLNRRKLIEISKENGQEVVKLTNKGKAEMLKFSMEELALEKPSSWNGKWWLVCYDIPKNYELKRDIFRDYLRTWKFYPLQDSVFIHAYPCRDQIEFLKEYLGVSEFVQLLEVSRIENEEKFRDFFGV